jgi:hypothetical protein
MLPPPPLLLLLRTKQLIMQIRYASPVNCYHESLYVSPASSLGVGVWGGRGLSAVTRLNRFCRFCCIQ